MCIYIYIIISYLDTLYVYRIYQIHLEWNWGPELQRPATGGALLVLWLWAAWLKSNDLCGFEGKKQMLQVATFLCCFFLLEFWRAVFFWMKFCIRRWWLKDIKGICFHWIKNQRFQGSPENWYFVFDPAEHKEPIQPTTSGRRTHGHLVISRLRAIHWETQGLLVRPAVCMYVYVYIYIYTDNLSLSLYTL